MATSRHKQRQRKLFDDIKLQAELLCDSHTAKRRDEIISRMLPMILELAPKGIKKNRLDSLAVAMQYAGYDDPTVMVEDSGLLFLNGSFDVDQLSKVIVWGDSLKGAMMQTVEGK